MMLCDSFFPASLFGTVTYTTMDGTVVEADSIRAELRPLTPRKGKRRREKAHPVLQATAAALAAPMLRNRTPR
jgi:hypothetical protein